MLTCKSPSKRQPSTVNALRDANLVVNVELEGRTDDDHRNLHRDDYLGIFTDIYWAAYPPKYPSALLETLDSTMVGVEKGFPILW
jgi:hypothetical protein